MTADVPCAAERALIIRVLDAVLREDVFGVRSAGVVLAEPGLDGGAWLRTAGTAGPLLLPVRPGGFLCELAARRPLVVRPGLDGGRPLTRLDAVLDGLRTALVAADDPDAEAGFAAFADECRAALDVLVARARAGHRVLDQLHRDLAGDPAGGYGVRGLLAFETAAAYLDHPAYPTAAARVGLSAAEVRRYAPEFRPTFPLRWLALPRTAVEVTGELPAFWPRCARIGRPDLDDASHLPVPVHPLTAARAARIGLGRRPGPHPYLPVVPTLSMRTVAVACQPAVHVKVPLPASTLGRRNRRSIKPGTLADGAAVQRLLGLIVDREPALAGRVLLADEATFGATGHEYLAFLVRRYPAGLDGARVVPVAALLAAAPDRPPAAGPVGGTGGGTGGGPAVIDALAAEFYGGDVDRLLDGYFALLFGWHTTLWLRYGVALEAHQQNTALVLDTVRGEPRLRLLYKDNDGARIDLGVLAARLGPAAPAPDTFTDDRMLVRDPAELASVFSTITLHLCAAAVVFGLAERHRRPVAPLLRLVRRHLAASLRPHAGTRDAPLLVTHVLDAPRLPVKSMVTAGTLLPKARTGAADVNKHYGTTAPNYLLTNGVRRDAG